jgi:hypothetical protein
MPYIANFPVFFSQQTEGAGSERNVFPFPSCRVPCPAAGNLTGLIFDIKSNTLNAVSVVGLLINGVLVASATVNAGWTGLIPSGGSFPVNQGDGVSFYGNGVGSGGGLLNMAASCILS